MTIKEIDAILEEGYSLKQIAASYTEIANLKIKKIRGEVERNRLFFDEIVSVYGLIKKMAIQRKVNLKKPKKILSLIITSNYRFYGKINSDLIDFFVQNTQSVATDKIIIGKSAIEYFKASTKDQNYTPFLLKGDHPDSAELVRLVNIIKDYESVLVFYSTMRSLLNQDPKMVDITASSSEVSGKNIDEKALGPDFRFIFEPELVKVIQFFDTQILTLLLEGTFLESELARTASRFISMDQAESEANKFIEEYEELKGFAKRSLVNKTILENFASMATLRKEEN